MVLQNYDLPVECSGRPLPSRRGESAALLTLQVVLWLLPAALQESLLLKALPRVLLYQTVTRWFLLLVPLILLSIESHLPWVLYDSHPLLVVEAGF